MLLLWILLSTFGISLLSFIGLLILLFKEVLLHKVLLFLVAFAAGTLMGGAFFHLLMESIVESGLHLDLFLWLMGGFTLFLFIEQIFHWHHSHHLPSHHHISKTPVTYMILLADGVHNFIDGLAIGSSFLISIDAGLLTVFIVAAHEIPQEFGDFGILVHGGWNKYRALFVNFISALTIIPGGILAYYTSKSIDISFLLPFTAGSFIYIASADLIPEIKHGESLLQNLLLFAAFIGGTLLILGFKLIGE